MWRGREKLSFMVTFACVVVVAAASSAAIGDITTGLVGYWDFEEGAGSTAYDQSPNGNNGQLSGGAWVGGVQGAPGVGTRQDPPNFAVGLDGQNDVVTMSDSNHFNFGWGDFSISVWIKTESRTAQEVINHHIYTSTLGTGYRIGLTPQGYISAKIIDGEDDDFALGSLDPVTDGVWHHLVMVRRGDTGELYVDTELQPIDVNALVGDTDVDDDLVLGYNRIGDPMWFDGAIDEVRLYNRALNTDDVLVLFPEPAALCLLAVGGLLIGATRESGLHSWKGRGTRALKSTSAWLTA